MDWKVNPGLTRIGYWGIGRQFNSQNKQNGSRSLGFTQFRGLFITRQWIIYEVKITLLEIFESRVYNHPWLVIVKTFEFQCQ